MFSQESKFVGKGCAIGSFVGIFLGGLFVWKFGFEHLWLVLSVGAISGFCAGYVFYQFEVFYFSLKENFVKNVKDFWEMTKFISNLNFPPSVFYGISITVALCFLFSEPKENFYGATGWGEYFSLMALFALMGSFVLMFINDTIYEHLEEGKKISKHDLFYEDSFENVLLRLIKAFFYGVGCIPILLVLICCLIFMLFVATIKEIHCRQRVLCGTYSAVVSGIALYFSVINHLSVHEMIGLAFAGLPIGYFTGALIWEFVSVRLFNVQPQPVLA